MMQPYTYLLINFFTIIVCFIYSFNARIKFNKHFGSFLKSAIIVAIPFIIWDIWFTKMGVWWFNSAYTVGIKILQLPLEEWLFFFCIPFSCVFTYYCLDKFFNLNYFNRFNLIIVLVSTSTCLIILLFFHNKIYTAVTAFITIATLLYLYFIAKVNWIGKASFVFFVLMAGFFPVNGILTGTGLESPIVNYNTDEILNIRMGTIPVEDAVYGYTQFLLNIYFFTLFRKTPAYEKQ